MALTLINTAKQTLEDDYGTTINCSSTLNVQAGDILIGVVTWLDQSTTAAIADTSSGNSMTMLTRVTDYGSYLQIGYKLVATANSSSTFRATLGSGAGSKTIMVYQFRPDAGDSVELDTGPSGNTSSGTSVASASFSTAKTKEILVGAVKIYATNVTFSNQKFGSTAAAGVLACNGAIFDTASWYYIASATMSSVTANCTSSDGSSWAAGAISIKVTPSVVTTYTISAVTTSYALTGTAATLKKTSKIVSGTASYALTGTAALLKYGSKLIATTSSYALTGTTATLKKVSKLVANTTSYSLTGTVATFKKGVKIIVDTASYTLTGTAATLKKTSKIVSNTTSYSLTGTAATLKKVSTLPVSTTSYSLTGTNAVLKKGFKVTVDIGSYTLTGTDTALKIGFIISVEGSSYLITGTVTTLTKSAPVIPTSDPGSYIITGTDVGLIKTSIEVAPIVGPSIGGGGGVGYSPLIVPHWEDEEELMAIICIFLEMKK